LRLVSGKLTLKYKEPKCLLKKFNFYNEYALCSGYKLKYKNF